MGRYGNFKFHTYVITNVIIKSLTNKFFMRVFLKKLSCDSFLAFCKMDSELWYSIVWLLACPTLCQIAIVAKPLTNELNSRWISGLLAFYSRFCFRYQEHAFIHINHIRSIPWYDTSTTYDTPRRSLTIKLITLFKIYELT